MATVWNDHPTTTPVRGWQHSGIHYGESEGGNVRNRPQSSINTALLRDGMVSIGLSARCW